SAPARRCEAGRNRGSDVRRSSPTVYAAPENDGALPCNDVRESAPTDCRTLLAVLRLEFSQGLLELRLHVALRQLDGLGLDLDGLLEVALAVVGSRERVEDR